MIVHQNIQLQSEIIFDWVSEGLIINIYEIMNNFNKGKNYFYRRNIVFVKTTTK